MKLSLLSMLLVVCSHAKELKDSSYWDVHTTKKYVHNSEMQRCWAMAFIAPYLKKLNGNELILDVGCGDGKITADISRFVPEGEVHGIDLSSTMVAWAQKQYHPHEYPNLIFKVGSFLEPDLDCKYDVIISFCALQHSADQEKRLRNLAQLLKPHGKLFILVPTRNNNAWNTARAETQAKSEWEPFWQNIAPRKTLSVEQYTEFLQKASFTDIRVEKVITMDPFIDKHEIIEWLCGTFAPQVPLDQRYEFYDEWIDEYLHLDATAVDDHGVIYAKFGYIAIVATISN